MTVPGTVELPAGVRRQLWSTTDWLGGWWPTAVSALALVVLVVVLVRLQRRAGRRRTSASTRRWPRLLTGAAAVLVLAAGCAFTANAVSGYVPSVAALRTQVTSLTDGHGSQTTTATTSAVNQVSIAAPARDRITATQAWVYTPPGYDQHRSQRYPVAYLLHGSPGRSPDWFAAGGIAHQMDVLIAARLVRPMIVVAPDVNGQGLRDSECLDSQVAGGPQVETYLNEVVVPHVDRTYRTVADWQHRVIGGMSSGGYCALDQGLRHPDLYGSIIALEAYGDPGSGGRAALGTSQAAFDAHSPSHYIPTMTFAHPVHVFLDYGSKASPADRAAIDGLAAALRARGQPVSTRVEQGHGHSWLEAAEGVPYGLVMASRAMP